MLTGKMLSQQTFAEVQRAQDMARGPQLMGKHAHISEHPKVHLRYIFAAMSNSNECPCKPA